MKPMTAAPNRLAFLLFFLTAVPIIAAALRLIQIPAGMLPEVAQHLTDTPVSHWLHALGGMAFGIIGPLQFTNVLKRRYGRLHKILGYIFVLSGVGLGISSIALLITHLNSATVILNTARFIAGNAVILCLGISMSAIFKRNIAVHRAWMIRAYAVGMGSATVVFFFIPYMLITGSEATGYASDLLFILAWGVNIAIAERVIRGKRLAIRSVVLTPQQN